MKNTVGFRDFELRDVDFVYRVKNDQRVKDSIGVNYSNFTYEEAIQWVKGCMKNSVNYKYWAICTNDEFQNIVGWCGLSWTSLSNTDELTATTKTLVIYDPHYRDTVTWFLSCKQLLEYAFEVIKAQRLYGDCLSSHTFHYHIMKSISDFLIVEEKDNALVVNGKSHDLAVFQLYRDDYEKMKDQGMLSYESIQSQLKGLINEQEEKVTCIEDYIKNIESILDNKVLITPETNFRDLDEWSSLLAVNLVTIAEKGFHTNFDMCEMKKCDTIRDLYEMVKSNSVKKDL